MATAARVPNVRGVYRRSFVGVFDDLVLAVAIGAERGLGDAGSQRLAVYAGAVLLHYFAMAHAAGIRHGGAESLRLGGQQLMRAAMAQGAIGRTFVAGLARQAVDAAGVVARLVFMAGDALRLGDVGRVRILLVRVVTGVAGQPLVSALLQLLPLIVAGSALRGRRRIGRVHLGAGCPE